MTALARARDDLDAALEVANANAAENEAAWHARHQALQAELDKMNAVAQEAAAAERANLALLETQHTQRERCVLPLGLTQ